MRKYCCFLCLLAVLIGLVGCDTYAMVEYYPWFRADAWYCEEIDMVMTFKLDQDGDLMENPESQLLVNGESMNVGVGFMASNISFFSEPDENNVSKVLMDGTWEYKGGNVVVTILKDELFSGQYSQLVYVPQ